MFSHTHIFLVAFSLLTVKQLAKLFWAKSFSWPGLKAKMFLLSILRFLVPPLLEFISTSLFFFVHFLHSSFLSPTHSISARILCFISLVSVLVLFILFVFSFFYNKCSECAKIYKRTPNIHKFNIVIKTDKFLSHRREFLFFIFVCACVCVWKKERGDDTTRPQ